MDKLLKMSEKELTRLEVMKRLEEKRMRQREAADRMGVSVRYVKRLLKAYRENGA
jgi:transposase